LIAGTGPEREALEREATELGIARKVRFAGHVRQEETPLYYSIASVFVLPSITTPVFKEPWGLVVNEAFNQGLPVIATDAVGAATGGLVQDGVNGHVVPEQNDAAIAKALGQLLDNPSVRNRMSSAARNTIASWNNEKMVAGFGQAIEYVLRNKERQR
jgi:glycosyltransferase involved in cell wall biosynthesis